MPTIYYVYSITISITSISTTTITKLLWDEYCIKLSVIWYYNSIKYSVYTDTDTVIVIVTFCESLNRKCDCVYLFDF